MTTLKDKIINEGFKPCPNWRGYGQKYERHTERGEEVLFYDTRNDKIQERYFVNSPQMKSFSTGEDITQLNENLGLNTIRRRE